MAKQAVKLYYFLLNDLSISDNCILFMFYAQAL